MKERDDFIEAGARYVDDSTDENWKVYLEASAKLRIAQMKKINNYDTNTTTISTTTD